VLIEQGGFDFSPYPRLHRWLANVKTRPAWKKTWQMIFGD
jgi:glutathione S-transferase